MDANAMLTMFPRFALVDCEHTDALGAPREIAAPECGLRGGAQRPPVRRSRADLEDVLERALGHAGSAISVAGDHAQSLADEVVWDLSHLHHLVEVPCVSPQDGVVQRIGQPGLKRGVSTRKLEHVA